MSADKVFYLHGLTAADGSFSLQEIEETTPANNFADLSEKSPSQVAPQFTGTHDAVPDIKLSTKDLGSLLTAAIAGSFNCAIDLSAKSMQLEYRKGAAFGTRTPRLNAANLYGVMQYNSLLCVESLEGRQGQLLKANCRLVSVMTDSADPLVFSNNVSLIMVGQISELFTLGPVKLNGTFMKGVQDWKFDNGVVYEEVKSDGDGFLSYVAVKEIKPRLTVHTRDTTHISQWGTRGTALSALKVFGRKKLKSAINVADATAQHLQIIATEGTIKGQQVQGDDQMAEVTIDLHETTEETAPYTMNLNSAIA